MAFSDNKETIIIGGGLTGLSTAWHLNGYDYLLLEKEKQVGGLAATDCIEDFSFDRGSHIWFTSNGYAGSFLQACPEITMSSHIRSAWVYTFGCLIPAPFQANLYGLPLAVVSDCLNGYIEARYKIAQFADDFDGWLRAQFGEGIYRHFMLPYNRKVWTVAPNQLATDWPGTRVDVPDFKALIDGAIGYRRNDLGDNATFSYPAYGGAAVISNTIARDCAGIRCGMGIEQIDFKAKTAQLTDGTRVSYRQLISTIPIPNLVSLMLDAPEEVKAAAQQLKATKVLLVNIAMKQRPNHKYHWIYFPEQEFPCFRISFPHNYANWMCPEGAGSLQAECAFPQTATLASEAVAQTVVTRLARVGLLEESNIRFVTTKLLNPAYVLCDKTRRRNLEIIFTFLHLHGLHSCGRFGAWEYLNMDGCIVAGRDAANWVLSTQVAKA